METGNEILKQVVPILMAPVNRHLRYLISCTKYMRDMDNKLAELTAKKVSVEVRRTQNASRHLEVPTQVIGWLEDVGKLHAKVENVPRDVGGCLNIKIRHRVGRNASNIIEEIDRIMRCYSLITWTDQPIPLGEIDLENPPTSSPSIEQNDFRSRDVTFTEALKALGPNHKTHMVALCGMGGVGKTTMMKKLKDVVEKKNMFTNIVMAVIGEKTDPILIQKAVADYLGIELSERTKPARADKLRQWFKYNSDGGNKKFLIVLDDVWQFVDLEDIGLSTLPNQGVNFKVLLTSRKRDVCTMMGVEANSILNVNVLEEEEAQNLFLQFVEVADRELSKIGEDIVRKCYGLPIAIKTMALTLRNKSKDSWKDALFRLTDHDTRDAVNKIFDISYRNLQDEETKAIFLLCGLFPDDFDIPTEELLRYGWGLNLFKKVYNIFRGRTRVNTCIERLMDSNLLIESNVVGCVKMHDLVRAFILDMYSKVEHCSIVNHGGVLRCPENDMSSSCKAISLTCEGMIEFPKDLNVSNLVILKLMHGDKSFRYSQDLYGEMEKLQVLLFDKMKYPLTPSSPQCSTNLRVLHLRECSLIFDCSSIGNLLNLEVLSFANSGIEWLPSTIGNLKKLRLLDMTGCHGLRIENGVLNKLVKLEELYMRVGNQYRKAIRFTGENCNEMAVLSKNLSALEFEFFENDAQLKNMSFENLKRFKISAGRSLQGDDLIHSNPSYENTLKLVMDKGELLTSRMNELFKETEVLCLGVRYMNDLSDVEVKSSYPPQPSSFYNLRSLVISKCAELRYLFTLGVAKNLSKLEHLEVYDCNNMEELAHNGGSGEEKIAFPKLKFLSLSGLPNLSGMCRNGNIIELPQLMELKLESIPGFSGIYSENKFESSCLLNEEFVIPKLEKLHINDMKNLKEIWPIDVKTSDHEVKLREIEVTNCDNLVNMFPCNPMSLLRHLKELRVKNCGSIKVLFHMAFNSVGEIREGTSSLRSISVEGLGKLRELWRIKVADSSCSLIRGFQDVEIIWIKKCEKFRNVFTPINTNFDMGALVEISVDGCEEDMRYNESIEISQEEEQKDIVSDEETSQVNDIIPNVVVPFCSIHSFHNIHKFLLRNIERVDAVFEIESPPGRELVKTRDYQQPILPYLENLEISHMDRIRHVWKCNWNKFFILQKPQSESTFHNLTTIYIQSCRSIKYLISPLMAKLLSNLKEVGISWCDGMEEVVSNRDDEDEDEEKTTVTSTISNTTITLFPHLHSLTLFRLPILKCIGGGDGGANGEKSQISFGNSTTTTAFSGQFKCVSWSLCQYSREINIEGCHALSSVIPCYAARQMQKLQVLKIENCRGMKEVFETEGMNNNKKSGCNEVNGEIPRLHKVIMLPNLRELYIYKCDRLEHIFTFSALESLRLLEELSISCCSTMKVIVKEENDAYGEQATTASSKAVVVFPRLKSIKLFNLPKLVGFFLGKNEFQWPSLDMVRIEGCPQMMVFAAGGSTTPQLKYISTSLGILGPEEFGLHFHVTTGAHHQLQTPIPSSCPATSDGIPWSFHNLIELIVRFNESIDKIIPSSELLNLQKLEKIIVEDCDRVEEVFEAVGTNSTSGFDESQTTIVKLPNLTQVELFSLNRLRYIWKSNQWTTFMFLNLTTLSISYCDELKHVFSSSMVSSLLQLEYLSIYICRQMEEVIVDDANELVEEEEEYDGKTNEIVLPRLKFLELEKLPCLKGFSLGKEDFSFPSLDTLIIRGCPEIKTFTKGNSATPELKEIDTNSGVFYVGGEDINSFVKLNQEKFIGVFD